MSDNVFQSFLATQQEAGLALAAASDLVTLVPVGPEPAQRYLIDFRCRGLVEEDGRIQVTDRFLVDVLFSEDHLRRTGGVLASMLAPTNVFHPNCRGHAICLGPIPPGTGLVDIIWQAFDIITWNTVTMNERDAFNWAACRWARNHPDAFPIDTRPLRRPGGLESSKQRGVS